MNQNAVMRMHDSRLKMPHENRCGATEPGAIAARENI
jgi:hypothetical protein